MDATAYKTLFFNSLTIVSQSYKMKYPKKLFHIYQRVGKALWIADFHYNPFLVEGKFEVKVSSELKPLEFDNVQFHITDPDKKHRIVDATRANAAFAAKALEIDSQTYRFACDNFAHNVEGYVKGIFDELLKKREDFLSHIAKSGGLSLYLRNHWRDFPYEAGLAYLCEADYNAAKQCFELAEQKNRIQLKSIGKAGRYLHLIFIDYCKAMLAGVEWTKPLVINGFLPN